MKLRMIFLALCLLALPMMAQQAVTDTVYLRFHIDSVALEEVEVKARKTPAANSRWSDMQPVELVTVGGANGDLYKALQTLPGTQVQGETGRLLVRGGDSNETQTYIDGMHVLKPYTSTSINSAARSRYSTFMFSGVNLASGGASQEYGEALSAVLPLETKDSSNVNKLGVNASVVGVGGGGTRAFDKGSLSVDLNYQNLGLYNKVYSGRREFETPYRMYSAATQFRYLPDDDTVLKLYAQYDRTDFTTYEGDERRLFDLCEDNVYLNATFRRRTPGGWNWFAGAAYSWNEQKIGGASVADDHWLERQQEWHLKSKVGKRLSSVFRMDVGVESYLRRYVNRYQLLLTDGTEAGRKIDSRNSMSPTATAGFLSGTYYPLEQMKAELSFRTEYASLSRELNFSPRLALNYYWGDVMLSATAGRYTQLPENEYLVRQSALKSEVCVQYNFGAQYEDEGRFYKAELYYKDYDRLALEETAADTGTSFLTSNGYGHSKGIDLFFRDRATFKNLEYQFSYTYNISKRKYQEYAELTTPQYATRHNASVVLKYTLPRLHTIVSVTNSFSSGRPYHNPALPGLMNDEVKPYNSLDLGLTYLPSKKVIIHASATNVLCRRNEYGMENGKPILASSDHFFYIGVYVTLGKKAAYDVSNF